MKSLSILALLTLAMVTAGCAPQNLDGMGGASPADPDTSSQEVFSEDLTQRTFAYFWDTTDTERCLAPDRWPSRTFSSIAATGFALTTTYEYDDLGNAVRVIGRIDSRDTRRDEFGCTFRSDGRIVDFRLG